jgi:enoyl-CoA hydratase/carnithine racemase
MAAPNADFHVRTSATSSYHYSNIPEKDTIAMKYIELQTRNGVAWIFFNRPEKLNAVNSEVMLELESALIDCEEDKRIRAVILTGNEKAFVAGADVGAMAEGAPGDAFQLTQLTHRVQNRLAALPKPTIAAVAGFALGAGCEIALCCDFRIAADNAVFGLPEISLAIIPGGGGTQRLPRLINPAKAARMILLGEKVMATEAKELGLVEEVVEGAQLVETASSLAARLTQLPILAVQAAKKAIQNGLELSLKDGLRLEQELFCQLFETDDQKEGMKAFLQKRKPVFTCQ